MIGDLVILLAIVAVAGGVGLWLGIVVLAPRLQRQVDRALADEGGSEAAEPATPAKEPDARTD